jgi:crotonobetainyl-CoA:carnitine CoA-transferase CaiB-like acyl-CoA transferase
LGGGGAAPPTAQALEALNGAGLPAGPIYTPQQALDDPQVKAMQFLHAVAGYPGLHQPVPVSGLPVQLSLTPGTLPERPPLLGEHTDGVLTELGYTSRDIAELRAHDVI